MFALYLFALAVGGALLLISLFGSDTAADDVSNDLGQNPVQWLSLRTIMYFLFVFGGVGAVLSRSWSLGALPVLATALVAGVAVGGAVSAAFGYLRRTNSGDRDSDESFVGLSGRMTLPFGAAGRGKVLVARGDRTFELLAQPLDATSPDRTTWNSVVVIEMRGGIAVVAPSDDPRARELSLLNP